MGGQAPEGRALGPGVFLAVLHLVHPVQHLRPAREAHGLSGSYHGDGLPHLPRREKARQGKLHALVRRGADGRWRRFVFLLLLQLHESGEDHHQRLQDDAGVHTAGRGGHSVSGGAVPPLRGTAHTFCGGRPAHIHLYQHDARRPVVYEGGGPGGVYAVLRHLRRDVHSRAGVPEIHRGVHYLRRVS
jgi:hypothetical protein